MQSSSWEIFALSHFKEFSRKRGKTCKYFLLRWQLNSCRNFTQHWQTSCRRHHGQEDQIPCSWRTEPHAWHSVSNDCTGRSSTGLDETGHCKDISFILSVLAGRTSGFSGSPSFLSHNLVFKAWHRRVFACVVWVLWFFKLAIASK